jgi:hypothetical protein
VAANALSAQSPSPSTAGPPRPTSRDVRLTPARPPLGPIRPMSTATRRTGSVCCANAMSGHRTPRNAMNR